jgi:hypothetical protein
MSDNKGNFKLSDATYLILYSLSTGYIGQFVKQEISPSHSFRCDQICANHCYEFGHTLLPGLPEVT